MGVKGIGLIVILGLAALLRETACPSAALAQAELVVADRGSNSATASSGTVSGATAPAGALPGTATGSGEPGGNAVTAVAPTCMVTFTPTDTPFGQTPRNLPLTASICQTNPQTGACINPTTPGPSATVNVAQNQSVVFSTFVQAQGTTIPYDPANSRIFVIAKQGAQPVGGTSAAVKMIPGGAIAGPALANPATSIVSSILPNTRTTSPGTAVTAFATIINAGSETANGCSVALPSGIPATFLYQTTDPLTNTPVGTADTPADIPAGHAQSFVFAITPTSEFTLDIPIAFACANTAPAPVFQGVNTFLLTSSTTPIADMISIASTISNDGNMVIDGATGIGAIATAAINLRACPCNTTFTMTPGFSSSVQWAPVLHGTGFTPNGQVAVNNLSGWIGQCRGLVIVPGTSISADAFGNFDLTLPKTALNFSVVFTQGVFPVTVTDVTTGCSSTADYTLTPVTESPADSLLLRYVTSPGTSPLGPPAPPVPGEGGSGDVLLGQCHVQLPGDSPGLTELRFSLNGATPNRTFTLFITPSSGPTVAVGRTVTTDGAGNASFAGYITINNGVFTPGDPGHVCFRNLSSATLSLTIDGNPPGAGNVAYRSTLVRNDNLQCG